jgi:hypothetical protein
MKIHLHITVILVTIFCLVSNLHAQEWYSVDAGFITSDTDFNDIYFTNDKNGSITHD